MPPRHFKTPAQLAALEAAFAAAPDTAPAGRRALAADTGLNSDQVTVRFVCVCVGGGGVGG